MRIALVVVLAACGAPSATRGAPTTPVVPGGAPSSEPARRFRQVTAGTRPSPARRTTFVLAGDGDRVTLTEIEERASRSLSLAETDQAAWTTRSQRAYRGTRRRIDGQTFDLALTAPDMQPLHLRCTTATVDVATAGARRVPSPTGASSGECDHGVWDPPATSPVEALVCGAAGQVHDDDHADHDDRLVFAPDPGVEWALQNDDCALRGGGLRRIAR